jgi:replicative superfamily II helicase
MEHNGRKPNNERHPPDNQWRASTTPEQVKPQPARAHKITAIAVSTGQTRPTSDFKAVAFTDISEFNPVQSAVLDIVSQDVNLVLASQTNTGKTKIAEMAIAACLKRKAGPAIYASPLKALSQEKLDAWKRPEHPFSRQRISIVTGDYRLTDARKKELEQADIIVMTSEMLDSRCRNIESEKSEFLRRAGVLVIDEMHLLGMGGRGDKLEAGMIRFSKINPQARLVALSATMPNMEELAGWAQALNGKETVLVSSQWRAVPLTINFRSYPKMPRYADTQRALYNAVLGTMEEFPKDKTLVFVHSKTAGRALHELLDSTGVRAHFHSADLELEERLDVERDFRDQKGGIRVTIATSTLAWGVNLPARRVIVAGVHRGLDIVSELDILQMAGRAGRMGLDDQGDAYILVPNTEADVHQDRILRPGPILSGLRDPSALKFHIIAEFASRECRTKEDIIKWYQRSLAQYQGYEMGPDDINEVVQSLVDDHALRFNGKEYEVTGLGRCASMFYLNPSDLWDYAQNWQKVFAKQDIADSEIVWALSHLRSYGQMIVSKAVEEMLGAYPQIGPTAESWLHGGQRIVAACYVDALQGLKPHVFLYATYRQVIGDYERITQALAYLDSMFGHWNRPDVWKALAIRLKYGVPANLVPLCGLKGVGAAKAIALFEGGIKSPADFMNLDNEMKIVAILASSAPKTIRNTQPYAIKLYKRLWASNFATEGVMEDDGS